MPTKYQKQENRKILNKRKRFSIGQLRDTIQAIYNSEININPTCTDVSNTYL